MTIEYATLQSQNILSVVKTIHTGEEFILVKLDQQHLPQIIALHDQTIASLDEKEKAFMVQKPPSFFRDHFNKASGNMVIGILNNNQLIAESIILCPSQDHPETGMVDMAPVAPPEHITILQGVAVLPEYRKNRLMHQMVNAWLNNSIGQGRPHALAEVEVSNIASWKTFLDLGLEITGIGEDPDDGALVYNMHGVIPEIQRRTVAQDFNNMAEDSILCCVDDIKKQRSLLESGYVINGYQKATREMILNPRP